jgi:hypothetical protein
MSILRVILFSVAGIGLILATTSAASAGQNHACGSLLENYRDKVAERQSLPAKSPAMEPLAEPPERLLAPTPHGPTTHELPCVANGS